MRRGRACAFFLSVAALGVVSQRALAGDDPLASTDPAAAADAGASADPFSGHAPPIATIRPHAYTLAECLALADRNFPNLWAARARLAFAHAQLDEAKWVPFWNWNASSNLAVLGPIGGTPIYTATGQTARNFTISNGLEPWWSVDINGTLPLYTFGKITAARQAAEANVRLNEWDLEKWRQQARMDVRRAYYGTLLARDARYILHDVMDKIDDAITKTKDKLATGKPGVDETDRISLEFYKDTLQARSGDPDKGERYALAALRFYTGVQTAFDVPDEPLKRPDVAFAPLIRYLAAARIFRPEVNMARAGMSARQAQVDLARANLFPDIGAGFGASYSIAPSAVPQYGNIWASDPFNHFYAGASSKRRGRSSEWRSAGSASKWRTPTAPPSRPTTASGAGTRPSTRRSSGS
jgi:multidrug efflux system outer membrane protein